MPLFVYMLLSVNAVTMQQAPAGTRATGSLCYRTGGYIRTALEWEFNTQPMIWAIKALLVQVPEPELYYPAGVELTLSLDERLIWNTASPPEPGAPRLADPQRED